jgi:hypothetical protein
LSAPAADEHGVGLKPSLPALTGGGVACEFELSRNVETTTVAQQAFIATELQHNREAGQAHERPRLATKLSSVSCTSVDDEEPPPF